MDSTAPFAGFTLPAMALAALVLLASVLIPVWVARRMHGRKAGRVAGHDALDTVASWPPEAARVLTVSERQAYDVLRRAMPSFLVLAQVPLSRFIRVPSRHSYSDWLRRVGGLSADLLLCDAGSRVLAVVDIRAPQESEHARRRHERMSRVLRKAGIHVLTWREGALPTPVEVRHAMSAVVGVPAAPAVAAPPAHAQPSRPLPLIPVAEISEVLAEGDRAALEAEFDPAMEPVPSAFFEELEGSHVRH